MNARLAEIHRFAVKGLGGERLAMARLIPERGMLDDRRFAFAHETSRAADGISPWWPKSDFLQMARDPAVMTVRACWDRSNHRLSLTRTRDTAVGVTDDPRDPIGRGRLEGFLAEATASDTRRRPGGRLVDAADLGFFDVRRPFVSIINRATVSAIEPFAGAALDPGRFRGNILIDGVPAWAELGWIGHDLTIGTVRLRVAEPIGRCAATTLDPDTGISDAAIPDLLRTHVGHNKCGVYAEILSDGEIAEGDPIDIRL